MSFFEIGAARVEITPQALGAVMLGYGDSRHRVKGVATPLYARAVALMDPVLKRRMILLCLDLCFISEILRQEIVKRLKLKDEEIMISATHTHSAPAGFSSYVLYGLSTDGFRSDIFETYVKGAVSAVEQALVRVAPGKIYFASGEFSTDEPVAFNRSMRARNRNPEVTKLPRKDRHLAVDREMTLLRFDRTDGTPIACWNWFSVHATSMHRDHFLIHSDNKGLAASDMEKEFHEQGHAGFVSVFAQGAAGDVSPNFRWYWFLREKRGANRSDQVSCQLNADLQRKKAKELFALAAEMEALPVRIESIFEYHDLSSIQVDPDLVGGRTGLRTGKAELGLPQLYGTAEGRGASYPIIFALHVFIRVAQLIKGRWPFQVDWIQGKKVSVIQSGESRVFNLSELEKLWIPGWVDSSIVMLKKWAKKGVLKQREFSPSILPIQLTRVGCLLIAAVPAEFTTVAGQRLCALIKKIYASTGVERVILQGFANAHSSYVVTPEEYEQQSYEGGCTHFGQWTLPAYLTVFRQLGEKQLLEKPTNGLLPKPLPASYLARIEMS